MAWTPSWNQGFGGFGQSQGGWQIGGALQPIANLASYLPSSYAVTAQPAVGKLNWDFGPAFQRQGQAARANAAGGYQNAAYELAKTGGAGGAARAAYSMAAGSTAGERAFQDLLSKTQQADLAAQGMQLDAWKSLQDANQGRYNSDIDRFRALSGYNLGAGEQSIGWYNALTNRQLGQGNQDLDRLRLANQQRQFDIGNKLDWARLGFSQDSLILSLLAQLGAGGVGFY